MTTLAAQTTIPKPGSPPAESMGELLQRLGGISPDCVRLRPAPGTATVADVVALDAHEDRLFELVDGTLVEKAIDFWKSVMAAKISASLGNWVYPRCLGVVTGAAGTMRIAGQVRMPDVAFTSWARLPDGILRNDPAPELAPDIAVEVLSDRNTKAEMNRKRAEYFQAGTQLVWIVDPESKTVTVYTAPEESTLLTEYQTLGGGSVLPGFTLELKDLFTRPSR